MTNEALVKQQAAEGKVIVVQTHGERLRALN
jgi:hypothetical protein